VGEKGGRWEGGAGGWRGEGKGWWVRYGGRKGGDEKSYETGLKGKEGCDVLSWSPLISS